jgi:hypothetical protein
LRASIQQVGSRASIQQVGSRALFFPRKNKIMDMFNAEEQVFMSRFVAATIQSWNRTILNESCTIKDFLMHIIIDDHLSCADQHLDKITCMQLIEAIKKMDSENKDIDYWLPMILKIARVMIDFDYRLGHQTDHLIVLFEGLEHL